MAEKGWAEPGLRYRVVLINAVSNKRSHVSTHDTVEAAREKLREVWSVLLGQSVVMAVIEEEQD